MNQDREYIKWLEGERLSLQNKIAEMQSHKVALTSTINRQNEEIRILKCGGVKPLHEIDFAEAERRVIRWDKAKKNEDATTWDRSPIEENESREAWNSMLEEVFNWQTDPNPCTKEDLIEPLLPNHIDYDELDEWGDRLETPELYTQHTFSDSYSPCGHCGGLDETITKDCVGRQLSDMEKSKISGGVLDFREGKWVNPEKVDSDE